MAATPRSIMILLTDGRKRLVSGIPPGAKITYGPISPGSQRVSDNGNALRIYTSAQNQLAVFTDVREFRDLSLTVEDECVTAKVEERNAKKPREITDPFAHCSLSPLMAGEAF
jgi:hypothetical protein